MQPIRILFDGDPAAATPWVGLAKKLARQTFKARIRNKTVQVADGVRIRVENVIPQSEGFGRGVQQTFGGLSKVWIESKKQEAVYQFIGSGPYLDRSGVDPDMPDRMLPKIYAVAVTEKGGALVSKPLLSNLEEDTQTPKRWKYVEQPYDGTDQPELLIRPVHQPDCAGVNQWFPLDGDYWLMTTFGQTSPCSGFGEKGLSIGTEDISKDSGYDFFPTYFNRKNNGKIYDLREFVDWPRQGCLIKKGGISVLVFIDVSNTFHCVKLPDETVYKSVPYIFPNGVVLEPVGKDSGITSEEYLKRITPLWKFNHSGTRAACIVAKRHPPYSDNDITSEVYTSSDVSTSVMHDSPLMVEVSIDVFVTDSELTGFSVTTRQVIDSLTDQINPVAVDYAFKVGQIKADSLVMMCYEHYINPLELAKNFSGTNKLVHPKKATIAVVKTQQPDSTEWVRVREWLAYYFVTADSALDGESYGTDFYPEIAEFTELADTVFYPEYPEIDRVQNYTFITQLLSFDLTTISFVLCATVSTEGVYTALFPGEPFDGGSVDRSRCIGAEAACTSVIVFNEVDAACTRELGHNQLVQPIYNMLHRVDGSVPDLTDYEQIYMSATIGYNVVIEEGNPQWNKSDVVVSNGNGVIVSSSSVLVTRKIVKGITIPGGLPYGFISIFLNPKFIDYEFVYCPSVVGFFDHTWPAARPGMVYQESIYHDILGNYGFSDYPFGMVHHECVHNATMTAQITRGGVLKTHPGGSWSVWIGPIAANQGIAEFKRDTYEQPSKTRRIDVDYSQTIIDKVVVSRKNPIDPPFISSNLSMLNAAFGKNFLVDDYLFNIRDGVSVGNLPELLPQCSIYDQNTWGTFKLDDNEGETAWDVVNPGTIHASFTSQLSTIRFDGYRFTRITPSIILPFEEIVVNVSGLTGATPMAQLEAVFHSFKIPDQAA